MWRTPTNWSTDKSVFPALEFLGWYTYAPVPSQLHVDLSEQFSSYSSSPLLLMLTPTSKEASGCVNQLNHLIPLIPSTDRSLRPYPYLHLNQLSKSKIANLERYSTHLEYLGLLSLIS